MCIRLSPYNTDVAASTVSLYSTAFAVQMLLKKPGVGGHTCILDIHAYRTYMHTCIQDIHAYLLKGNLPAFTPFVAQAIAQSASTPLKTRMLQVYNGVLPT